MIHTRIVMVQVINHRRKDHTLLYYFLFPSHKSRILGWFFFSWVLLLSFIDTHDSIVLLQHFSQSSNTRSETPLYQTVVSTNAFKQIRLLEQNPNNDSTITTSCFKNG